SGATISGRHRTNSGAGDGRDRQAVGSGQDLCRPAQALDRRTHACLARPLPTVGQGLGMPQPQGARLPPPRLHPPHAAKTMQPHMKLPDRLLELSRIALGEDAEIRELRDRYASLSRREQEVMALVVRGLLNKLVAAE